MTAPHEAEHPGADKRPPQRSPRPYADIFGVRRGERSLALLFFTYFLLLMASEYAVKSVRQSSYIDIVGAQNLPYVYLLLALLSFPALLLYSRLTRRFDDPPLIVALVVLRIVGLVLFFVLFGRFSSWLLAFAFYLWATLGFGVEVSQFWSFANNVFDARQARRLFAVVGAGGLLGGVPGGQIARLVTGWAGTRYTLLAAALVLAVAAVVVVLIAHRRSPRARDAASSRTHALQRSESGFQALRGSRLLGLIALLMLLMVVVSQAVDLQFNWVIQQHTTSLDQRTSVMGNFFTLMGLAGFVFQILLTQRIHRALGVGVAMRVLPTAVGLITVLMLLSFVAFPAGVLALAWALRLSDTSLRHSVDQATRELLFLPVSQDLRRRAKGFIDVFVQRVGEGVGALLLLPVTFAAVGVSQVGWLILALVAAWLWVTVAARREYVLTFRRSLKPGPTDMRATIDTRELTTITTLVRWLGSADTRQVMHGLELLAAYGEGELVPPLLLHHESAQVRCKTLEILADAGRVDALPLIEQRITDDSAEVRSAAVSAVAALRGEAATDIMMTRLADPDPRQRAAAVACLASHHDGAVSGRALETLRSMLADSEPEVRAEAAKALGQVGEPTESDALLLLLYDDDVDVVGQAIAAVRSRQTSGGDNPIYIPKLISLMANRRLKHQARDAVIAFGDRAIPAVVTFLKEGDEQIWVRRALPKTLALLGGDGAFTALSDLLASPDEILREKVVEAMVSLRGRHPGLRVRRSEVQRHVRAEVVRYLSALASLWAVGAMHEAHLEGAVPRWRSAARVPTLLQETLAQRMAVAVKNIAGMLELVLPSGDVRAAFRSLSSPSQSLRARALEYLDNTLGGALRHDVFAAIDDAPVEAKLRRAQDEYGVTTRSPERTIERIIRTDVGADPSAVGLVLAAMHAVHLGGTKELYPLLEEIASNAAHPLLGETAAWVLAQAGASLGGAGDATPASAELE